MAISDIVASVKRRAFITTTDSDELITDLAGEMAAKVLEYCHLDALPEGLNGTVVSMTSDRFQELRERAGNATGIVASVSDGQQSVSYKSSAEAAKLPNDDASFLRGYLTILNQYRKVKFR